MSDSTDNAKIFAHNIEAIAGFDKERQTEEHGLLAPIATPFHLPTPIYGAMFAIWHLRPFLQQRFPLHKGKPKYFVRFLAWCAIEGRHKFAILRSIPEWDTALAKPLSLPAIKNDKWHDGFSVAMFLYGVARYRYFTAPIMRDAQARHSTARAFWRGERHKLMLPAPSRWQIEFMENQFGTIESLINQLRLKKKDGKKTAQQLAEAFALTDIFQSTQEPTNPATYPSNPPQFHTPKPLSKKVEKAKQSAISDSSTAIIKPSKALLPAGLDQFYIRLPIPALRELAWLRERIKRRPSQLQLANKTGQIPINQKPVQPSPFPFGVNLFGYAQGELGIGEDVRLVALSLQSQKIPFCIVNVKPGENVSQKDNSANQWLTDKPRYAINIFCTTGIEQVHYACAQGLTVFKNRYNIGFWPWELPDWPASCSHAFSMVDEIWGISRYTANAYRRAKCPIYTMSLPVTIDKIAPIGRKDFGLPKDAYLFVFSFDFNSTLARKNPKAVIHAFQRAFPIPKGDKVGLVVKVSHINKSNKEWKRLKSLINTDPRIHLIDTTLRRPEVLALYQCCDCYVSLHRAEGFGRGLAEALMLDLQLIATNFSGNLDFCTEERVGLVRCQHQNVRNREYFHADGQRWADPDIDHAAELMRSIRTDPRPIKPRTFDFSPATMGSRYAKRLHAIKQQLNLAKTDLH